MNRKIIYSILILLSFCFVDNVSALSYVEDVADERYYIAHKWVGNDEKTGNDCYYFGWFNKSYDITISNYTITSGTNITYYKICDYDNFIEFLDTGDSSLLEAATTNNNSMSLNTDSSYMMYSNFDLVDENGNVYFAKNEYKGTNYNNLLQLVGGYNWSFKKYYGVYLDSDNQKAYVYGSSNWNSPTNTYSLEEYPYWIGWETDYAEICYSSSPFYYDTSTSEYKTGGTFKCGQSNLSFDSETSYNYNTQQNSNYEFVTNYDIYTEDGTLYNEATVNMSSTPNISITKESETKTIVDEIEYITDVTLNVEFSHIDNENYLYQYRYGSNNDWATITLTQSNSFSKTYMENDTFYVRILDIKNEYNIVSSATFSINNITSLPDIDDNDDSMIKEDTINSSVGSNDVVFHKCDLNLQTGVALCEVTFNNFDNSLYKYYYKIGDSAYSIVVPNEKTEVLPEVYDTSLLIKSNDDISLYKKWQSANDENESYDLVLKIYENTTITILRENKETGDKQYYTFTITSLTESDDMSQIEQFIYDHLLSKFYFVSQFKQIIEYVSSYDFEENAKAPQFTFDLGFIGMEPVTVDMEVDEHTRLLIHGYIKLFASVMVVFTFIKETAKLFKK